jgi:hypothetical protein
VAGSLRFSAGLVVFHQYIPSFGPFSAVSAGTVHSSAGSTRFWTVM